MLEQDEEIKELRKQMRKQLGLLSQDTGDEDEEDAANGVSSADGVSASGLSRGPQT